MGKWQRARSTQALCTDSWKTFPAFGYARRLDLTINIKDVAWENGSWINTWVIKNALFLEVSFTDYVLALYMFCWLYALSSLFLAPIKRLDCRNKLVSPCRDCPSVVLSGSPFPSPGDISPISLHGILQARVLEWVAISFSRGFSQPSDQTEVSCIPGRRFNL